MRTRRPLWTSMLNDPKSECTRWDTLYMRCINLTVCQYLELQSAWWWRYKENEMKKKANKSWKMSGDALNWPSWGEGKPFLPINSIMTMWCFKAIGVGHKIEAAWRRFKLRTSFSAHNLIVFWRLPVERLSPELRISQGAKRPRSSWCRNLHSPVMYFSRSRNSTFVVLYTFTAYSAVDPI